jgi:hypothetical protein
MALFFQNWDYIRSIYCQANLTFEKDRKVVLGGVLSVLHNTTGLQFVAGMCTNLCLASFFGIARYGSIKGSIRKAHHGHVPGRKDIS